MNKMWCFCVRSSGLNAKLEMRVDPLSQKRSADTLVECWDHGCPCAQDWVVTHVFQQNALVRASPDPDAILREAESRKVVKSRTLCEGQGVDFIPLALDTLGGFGAQAMKAIGKVADHARLTHGKDNEATVNSITQRLRVAMMRGVAQQILLRASLPEAWPDFEERDKLDGEVDPSEVEVA